MSERLDRIEMLLEAHGMAMADMRAKQEVTQRQIDGLATESAKLNSMLDRLSNIVLKVHNRQDDHEDRINRLEQP